MKRKPIALLLILSMLLALSLTGCGKDTALTVYAEGNFIRQDLIDAFTEETGIEVNYIIGTRSPAETKAKTDDANTDQRLQRRRDGGAAGGIPGGCAVRSTGVEGGGHPGSRGKLGV